MVLLINKTLILPFIGRNDHSSSCDSVIVVGLIQECVQNCSALNGMGDHTHLASNTVSEKIKRSCSSVVVVLVNPRMCTKLFFIERHG